MSGKETDSVDFELDICITCLNLLTSTFAVVMSKLFIAAFRMSALDAILSAHSLRATAGCIRCSQFKVVAFSNMVGIQCSFFYLAIWRESDVESDKRSLCLFMIWESIRVSYQTFPKEKFMKENAQLVCIVQD